MRYPSLSSDFHGGEARLLFELRESPAQGAEPRTPENLDQLRQQIDQRFDALIERGLAGFGEQEKAELLRPFSSRYNQFVDEETALRRRSDAASLEERERILHELMGILDRVALAIEQRTHPAEPRRVAEYSAKDEGIKYLLEERGGREHREEGVLMYQVKVGHDAQHQVNAYFLYDKDGWYGYIPSRNLTGGDWRPVSSLLTGPTGEAVMIPARQQMADVSDWIRSGYNEIAARLQWYDSAPERAKSVKELEEKMKKTVTPEEQRKQREQAEEHMKRVEEIRQRDAEREEERSESRKKAWTKTNFPK
ncbi:hypothetical protein HY213_03170 [Candidatus Peregrinibacteria bacterium]|nr:hypothetical protein [Candidatus Peregrinibacteria bacterium]